MWVFLQMQFYGRNRAPILVFSTELWPSTTACTFELTNILSSQYNLFLVIYPIFIVRKYAQRAMAYEWPHLLLTNKSISKFSYQYLIIFISLIPVKSAMRSPNIFSSEFRSDARIPSCDTKTHV